MIHTLAPRSAPRSPRTAALTLLLALPLCADLSAQKKKGGDIGWPFGKAAAAGGAQASMNKRDLFNLGLLGAKAWDADREEPNPDRRGGKRSFKSSGDHGEDVGPKRLVIRALLGSGPAQKAGLRYDDVITGVDQQTFANGSFAPLATALIAAEASRGKLTLHIERKSEKLDLLVRIKKAGKDAAQPTTGKHAAKIQKSALIWLADHQSGDGGFPETLGGKTGAVVNTCLAGLAWISGGSSLKGGKHKSNIDKASKFVLRGLYAPDRMGGMGAGANWNQTTWSFAHAAIFLGELQLASKSKKLKPELQKIADILCKRQEATGGFGHGPGGKNALGYIELNILGGYVLSGLSLAKQAGCKVDEKITAQLETYLEASASESGGVGYSTAPGQKGSGNIGRTAVAYLGSIGLGNSNTDWTKKMAAFVREHIADTQGGHASLQQHILCAGVAAAALGGDAHAKYWAAHQRDLTLARVPDGSIQARPWHESLLMQSNTDVSMGQVWSTASWAIVLGARPQKRKKGGLPGWCGTRVSGNSQ